MLREYLKISKTRHASFILGTAVAVLGVLLEIGSIYVLSLLVGDRNISFSLIDGFLSADSSIFLLFTFCLLTSITLRALSEYYSNRVRILLERDLRQRFLSRVLSLGWPDFSKLKSGELVKTILSECHQIGTGVAVIMMLLSNALSLGIITLIIFYSNPLYTSGFIVFVMLVFFTSKLVKRMVNRHSSGISDTTSDIGDWSRTLFSSYKFFLANNFVDILTTSIDKNIKSYSTGLLRSQKWAVLGKFTTEISAACFIITLLGVMLISSPDNLAYALITIAFISRTVPRLISIQTNYFQAQINYAWLQNFNSRLQRLPVIPTEQSRLTKELQFTKTIDFTNVSLKINGETIVHNFDLNIKKNQTYVITGPSGSGKSMLTEMFMGLRTPSSGSIKIDGVELSSENLDAWRQQIVYLGQNQPLFTGTLRQNLMLGSTDYEDSRYQAILSQTGLINEVAKLPNKLDYVLTEDGGNLSGGQRQRVGLASCLLRANNVIILDEPTSALDQDNVKIIEKTIKKLKGKYTLIIVTHDESLLQLADVKIRCNAGIYYIDE